MSSKTQIGLSSGVVALSIFTLVFIGYYITETKRIAEDAKTIAADFDKRVSKFIDNWNKRVQVSNKINNGTQSKLLNLSIEGTEQERQLLNLQKNASEILKLQLANEKHIQDNLTRHRIVANQTRDNVLKLQNDTNTLIHQFNQTNENERTKAVNNILEGVEHIIGQLDEKQKKAVANLTAQHDDILNLLKTNSSTVSN